MMRIPVSWLREYVAFDAPLPELAERLAVATAEVERISRRGVPDEGGNLGLFRVGRVLEAGKHPNADRLQLCRVDVGEARAAPDRLRRLELRRGRDRRGRAPGRGAPGRAHARAGEAARRGLGRDDPLRATSSSSAPTTPGSSCSPTRIEPGTPLADVLPIRDEVLEVELTGEPPRPALDLRARARGRGPLRRSSSRRRRAPIRTATGDEPVEHRDRRPRRLPALHRPALPRRARSAPSPPWLKARLRAAGHAPDLERRRRDELRHARARQPAARVRPRRGSRGGRIGVRRAHAGRGAASRSTASRRELDPSRPADRRRASAPVALAGIMGGARVRGRRDDDRHPARGGELRAGRDPARARSASGCAPRRSNRWEKGVDPYARRAGRRSTRRSCSSSSRARAGRARATSTASCRRGR